MTAPTHREWFRWNGEHADAFWPREIVPVVKRWEESTRPIFLRVTVVSQEWLCLEGWHTQWELNSSQEPTVDDAPVGFA